MIDNASHRTSGGNFSPDKTVYPTPWEDRPPLKQFKDGINPEVIHCNDDLVLIQKYDGTPACVKEQTKTKLIERGWMIISSDFETQREIAKEIFKSLRTGKKYTIYLIWII